MWRSPFPVCVPSSIFTVVLGNFQPSNPLRLSVCGSGVVFGLVISALCSKKKKDTKKCVPSLHASVISLALEVSELF